MQDLGIETLVDSRLRSSAGEVLAGCRGSGITGFVTRWFAISTLLVDQWKKAAGRVVDLAAWRSNAPTARVTCSSAT